jgi:hypothetical protein
MRNNDIAIQIFSILITVYYKNTDFPRRPIPENKFPSRSPLAPVDNEIPDSANVQANPGQGANVPNSVENETVRESRQAQLNLGTSFILVIQYKTYFN